MENFTPLTSFLGGSLIGLSATLILLFAGQITGVSGMMAGVINADLFEKYWRFAFLIGVVLGAMLFHRWEHYTSIPDSGLPLIPLIIGGVLVGFGTRMGNGCTSGHGICGIARLSKRSIVATLVFMGSGMIAATFIRPLLGV
jgi:uncharacterized membrane protein YedE/YeeE